MEKGKTKSSAENRMTRQTPWNVPKDDASWEEQETTQRDFRPTKTANKSWNDEMVDEEEQLTCSTANATYSKTGKDDKWSRKESRDGTSDRKHNSNHKGRDRDAAKPYATRRSEPFRGDRNDDRRTEKRTSWDEKQRPWRSARDSSNGRRKSRNDQSEDEEFLQYQEELSNHKRNIEYVKTKERTSDLFDASEDYALAHCVAEDMNMGSGIAVQFRHRFKRVGELLNQGQRTGGLAILEDKERYVYYLVTKKFSTGKPTYSTLFSSLKCLRGHVLENKVGKIAMPRIGCGLDRLEWSDVKFMIEFVFRDVDIEIVVCNLEPTEESSPQQKHRNCKVTHEKYPIQDIESKTVVLYFSAEDGCVSEEMEKLDEKFRFLLEFKHARKSVGNVVFYTKNPGYLLCGCIVRKTRSDRFDFVALQKCLTQIQKENKKYEFYYYAFQAMRNKNDFCINYKIMNILRNSLRDVEVYVCWPGDLQNEMAPRDRFEDQRDSLNKSDELREKHDWKMDKERGSDWRRKNDDYDKGTQYKTPVRDEGRKRHREYSHSKWSSPPVEQDKSSSEAPDANDSGLRGSPVFKNYTEPKHDWFDTQSSVVLVDKIATKSNDIIKEEFETFRLDFEACKIDTSNLKEQEIYKACCRVCYVREDFMVEGGIPHGEDIGVHMGKLLKKQEKEGGLACCQEPTGFLYFLVISRANSPATSNSVFSSIKKLQEHVVKNRVRKIVIPVLDDVKDGPKWKEIEAMFEFLIRRKQVEIILAKTKLQSYNTASLQKQRKIRLVHKRSAIHQMAKKSIILYLASADDHFTEEMTGLARKFDFLEDFKKAKKFPGAIVSYKENEDHVLYGCVVKKTFTDVIDFEEFRKCLLEVMKINSNREKLGVVGIQAVKDSDEGMNFKIMTVLLHCLESVTLHVCWPGELKNLMPS